jgi:hypothetical protein
LTVTQIYCNSDYGPCFDGGGESDLSAFYEPFNGDRNCRSYANKPGYRIPVDEDGRNMLTNKEDSSFTISELEVWEVVFIH